MARFQRHLIGDLLELRIGPGRAAGSMASDSAVDWAAGLGGLLAFLAPISSCASLAADRPPLEEELNGRCYRAVDVAVASGGGGGEGGGSLRLPSHVGGEAEGGGDGIQQ